MQRGASPRFEHAPRPIQRRRALIVLDMLDWPGFLEMYEALHEDSDAAGEPLDLAAVVEEWREARADLIERYRLADLVSTEKPADA
jgi:hypothetical protein